MTDYRLGHINPNEMRTVNVHVRSNVSTDELLRSARDQIIEAKRQLKADRRKLIATRAHMQGLVLENLEIEITEAGEVIGRTKDGKPEELEGLL